MYKNGKLCFSIEQAVNWLSFKITDLALSDMLFEMN